MLDKISIKNKVLLLLTLPLVALFALTAITIADKTQMLNNERKLTTLIELSTRMSDFAHEQQKERGMSGVFIGSNGTKSGNALVQQRKLSDAAKSTLTKYIAAHDLSVYGPSFVASIDAAMGEMSKIDTVRKSIDSLTITRQAAIDYYTGVNTRLMDVIFSVQDHAKDPKMMIAVSAYVSFLKAKEAAGMERAVGAKGFSEGFSEQSLIQFQDVISRQNVYWDVFRSYATKEQKKRLEQALQTPVVGDVQKLRNLALSRQVLGSPSPVVDSADWFNLSTKKVDLLMTVEDSLVEDLISLLNDLIQESERERTIEIAGISGILLLILVLAYKSIQNIVGGVGGLTNCMKVLANGDLTVEIPSLSRRDEIGQMAHAVEIFKKNGIERKELEAQQSAAQAKDLERARYIEQLISKFENSSQNIVNIVSSSATELQATAQQMSSLIESTAALSHSVLSSAEQSNENVQSVAAASEELSAAIGEVSSAISRSAEMTRSCSEDAFSSQQELARLQEVIGDVDQIIQSINDVAEQTNLLALNATIEAARAGEAGKGFAVVASEVKNLANQTHKMTDDITEKINAIKSTTEKTVHRIQTVISQITKIDETSGSIASAVEEQNSATFEISRSAQSAAAKTADVTGNIQGINESTSQSDAASQNVRQAADVLAREAVNLKDDISQFLDNVRAA
jgi:methyl-accepting chemotaxis protein